MSLECFTVQLNNYLCWDIYYDMMFQPECQHTAHIFHKIGSKIYLEAASKSLYIYRFNLLSAIQSSMSN